MSETMTRKPVALYYTQCGWHPDNMKFLEENFNLHRAVATRAHIAIGPKVEALIVCPTVKVDSNLLRSFPNLKVILSATTRTPFIDLPNRSVEIICLEHERSFLNGITATAEHTLGLIHAIHRRIPACHYNAVRHGSWNRKAWPAPRMLSQMRLGILGAGRVGRHLSRFATPLFRAVVMSDDPAVVLRGGFEGAKIDVLTLHLGLGHSGLVDIAMINKLNQGALLINTAQGNLINLDHAFQALDSGQLRGLALDVLPGEPEPFDFSLESYRRFDRQDVILSQHIAGSTEDAWLATERKIIELACDFFKIEMKEPA